MGLIVAVGFAEAISVVTVLESVAAVGAVLSVVGAVTKNKTLSTIGLGLGVVGGVGALAAGALGASSVLASGAEASTAAGDAAAVAQAGDAATIGAGAAPLGGGVAGDALTTATAGVGAADAVPDTIGALSATSEENLTLASTAKDVGSTAATNPADAVASGTTGSPSTGVTAPATTATTATPPPSPPAVPSTSSGVDTGTWDTPTPKADASVLDKLVTYAGKYPVVALGVLQAGGSLLSGAFSSLTPAQAAEANARAAANDAAAAQQRMQTANLQMPKAVASSAPVTGSPQTLVPAPPAGFINQPQQIRVTGAPA